MKPPHSKRGLLAVLVIVARLLFAFQAWLESRTNPAASPMTEIQQIETRRAPFNQTQGQPRLILLVSPT